MASDPDTLHLTFRPYREENLTPLTLREDLLERYLRQAIEWLINLEEPERPMRAQETNSPWQIAQSIAHCLEARALFKDQPWATDLTREVERKVLGEDNLEGAVRHLLRLGNHIRIGEHDCLTWDGRLYDTGCAVSALISVFNELRPSLRKGRRSLRRSLNQAVVGGLNWICSLLQSGEAIDADSTDAYQPVTRALTLALDTNRFGWKRLLRSWRKALQQEPLEHTVDFILSRSCEGQDNHDADDVRAEAEDRRDIIQSFAYYLDHVGPSHDRQVKCVTEQLARHLECLEQDLLHPSYSHPDRSTVLAIYVLGMGILSKTPRRTSDRSVASLNHQGVLSILNRQASQTQHFEDGSIFHDLYATNEFTFSVLKVLQYWPWVYKPVIALYDSLLARATKGSQMSEERKQVFALIQREQDLERQILQIQYRNRWCLTVISLLASGIVFILSVLPIWANYGQNPEIFWAALGAILGVIVTIDALVVSLIWQWFRRE